MNEGRPLKGMSKEKTLLPEKNSKKYVNNCHEFD